jgi:hypothetical protein
MSKDEKEPGQVINIKTYQVLKRHQNQELRYKHSLMKMDKVALLQELLHYHEAYQHDPFDINVTIRGQMLMEILEERAELSELQELSREFQEKLKVRLYQQLQNL